MTPAILELMRDIERAWDAYQRAVHVERSLDAALAALAPDTSLLNLPAGTGGADRDAVARYLADDLLPHLPADLTSRRVSRTVDRFRVVDESVVAFTHDGELPWLLPGLPATHRRAEVVTVTVATLRRGRIVSQRTLWDHAGLTAQLGAGSRSFATMLKTSANGYPEPSSWW